MQGAPTVLAAVCSVLCVCTMMRFLHMAQVSTSMSQLQAATALHLRSSTR